MKLQAFKHYIVNYYKKIFITET